MKLTTFAVLFAVTLMVSGTIFGSVSIQEVEAVKAKGVGTQKYGSSTGVCGDRLCSEIAGGREAWEQQRAGITPVVPDYGLEAKDLIPEKDYNIKPGTQMSSCNCSEDGTCSCGPGCTCSMADCNCSEDGTCTCGAGCNCSGTGMHSQCQCGQDGCNCPGCSCSEDGTCTCHGDGHQCSCGGHDGMKGTCASCAGPSGQMHGMYDAIDSQMKTESDTIQSKTDPGLGHEQHQLAVILPPSDKMYKGVLTYSASENVQLVALHGPLTNEEVMGQATWTPDGKTHFALTLV
ncbi:MAG: hypothetical protein ACO2Y5_08845, partial [Nitrosopumilaceae archaeon]